MLAMGGHNCPPAKDDFIGYREIRSSTSDRPRTGPAKSPMLKATRAPLSFVMDHRRHEASDTELARGMIAGEPWATAEAWYRFAPMVLSLAERTLGSRNEAEDAAQDVFCRLFHAIKGLSDEQTPRSFVHSIARRTLKSRLRYHRVRAWLSFHGPETLVNLQTSTQDVESRDLLRRLYGLLERLSARNRLVFMLRRVDAMTVEEIATALAVSESTVKRSFAHASNRLSHWIDTDPALADLTDGTLLTRLG